MRLADATSREEVEAALAAGDEELAWDIEDQLDDARRRWQGSDYSSPESLEGPEDLLEQVLERDDFVTWVIYESPAEYDLRDIPSDSVAAAIGALRVASYKRRFCAGPFCLETDARRGHGHFALPTSGGVYFPDDFLPEGAEFIPAPIARSWWDEVGYDVSWEQTDKVREQGGSVDMDPAYIVTDDDFPEWCRDTRAEFFESLPDDEKLHLFFRGIDAGLRQRLVQVLALDLHDPRCFEHSDEDLVDYASQWLAGDEETQKQVERELESFTDDVHVDPGEPLEVIREITRDDLQRIGITRGVFWETAPWKLVKLKTSDLREEGRRMRHCVGDLSMGYLRALADGDVEIWSLRSRDNKPRFTLEVDPSFWDSERWVADGGVEDGDTEVEPHDAEVMRGYAIRQLKGKANRLPGFAGAGDQEVRFPDELIFWSWLLGELGVNEHYVKDFSVNNVPAWRLMPNRSFDEPYQRRRSWT